MKKVTVEYKEEAEMWNNVFDSIKEGTEFTDNLYNYSSGLHVGMGCLRRAVYDVVLGWRNRPQKGRERAMWGEIGDAIHNVIVDKYKMAGRCGGVEVRGTHGPTKLSYRIDMLYKEDDGTLVPLEIKSMNKNAYDGMKATYGPNKGEWFVEPGAETPKIDHIIQLMSYMHFHRGPEGEPTPYGHGYLHYHSKNDNVNTVYRIEYDPELGAAIEETLRYINNYADLYRADNKTDVPTISTKWYEGENVCNFCPYGGNPKYMVKNICNDKPFVFWDSE